MKAHGTVESDFVLEFNDALKQRLVEYYQDDWADKGLCDLALLLRDFYDLERLDGFADAKESGLEAHVYWEDGSYNVWKIDS